MLLPERYSKCSEILEQNAKPSGVLYHYTNSDGLRGILQSQQLWLTDYSQLNDTSEIKYGIKKIRNHILNHASDKNIKLFWEAIFDDIHEIVSNIFDFFVFSFCMKKNYLYAWREYADDAAGFSIGFKKEFFSGIAELPNKSAESPNFGRTKAYYNYKYLAESIINLMNVTQGDLLREGALYACNDSKIKRDFISKWFAVTLFPYLISIKHKAYKDEHEHRIYTLMPRSMCLQRVNEGGDVYDVASPNPNARKRVYFDFDLQNISEIWVGPRLNFKDAKRNVEEILSALKSQGKIIGEIKIIASKIPYKNF